MTKILMVCLGNICRSPLAEGILRSKIGDLDIIVDSAGTAAYHEGNPPDKRSIAIAKKYGLDISGQRARKFTIQDFEEFDKIYVMDKSNFSDILSLSDNSVFRNKVELILKKVSTIDYEEVPDPYYGGNDGFELVYGLLDEACNQIISDFI